MHRLNHITAIARYTLLDARRGQLLWVVLLAIAAAVALGGFLSEIALTETRAIEAAFIGSMLRWAAVAIVSLAVITGMVREFNDKGFELVLSLPIPRADYFFGKLLGYTAVALLVAFLMSVAVLLVASPVQAMAWGLSLGCELLVMSALSLLCMFTLRQTLPAFAVVVAFYLLARSIAAITLMAQSSLVHSDSLAQSVINAIVSVIGALLPALDRFTATEWLVYSTADAASLAAIVAQCAVYVLLLVGASLFDLYRKNL